jgi:hypothetical protein
MGHQPDIRPLHTWEDVNTEETLKHTFMPLEGLEIKTSKSKETKVLQVK